MPDRRSLRSHQRLPSVAPQNSDRENRGMTTDNPIASYRGLFQRASYRGSMQDYFRSNSVFAPALVEGAPAVDVSDLSDEAVAATAAESKWLFRLLLVFLLLLYANTPFILPQMEVLRPAKIVAVAALLALLSETA